MEQLDVSSRDLLEPALRSAIKKYLDEEEGKNIWQRMPKEEDSALYGLDAFVNLMLQTVSLMKSVMYDVEMRGHVIFAEDSQAMENNLFQLFVEEEGLFKVVTQLTGSTPRAVLMNTCSFKSWHGPGDNRDSRVR